MRNFMDIIGGKPQGNGLKNNTTLGRLNESLLREFATGSFNLNYLVSALSHEVGGLQRVGGNERTYTIDNSQQMGAVYVIKNTTTAIGMGWSNSASGVESIYVWHNFSINRPPSYVVDLPANVGEFTAVVTKLVELIRTPRLGQIAVNESSKITEARRTSADEFVAMARTQLGAKAGNMTLPDMMDLAKKNDVQIPSDVRVSKQYKLDAHHWNLIGADANTEDTNAGLAAALGGEVSAAPEHSEEYADAIALAKAKTVTKLASQGKIYLLGRGPKGAFFRIPGLGEISARLEKMLARSLAERSPDPNKTSMEIQYENLVDKVRLVAGGKSNFLKSLIITGAPSSGKSYNVMETIKELGLEEGVDYIVKTGEVTKPALYRLLIEQVNGMIVFDDCDDVVQSTKTVNMLKGALNTGATRAISYDMRGTINVAVLTEQKREEYVNRLSRLLRGGIPTPDDHEFFQPFARVTAAKKKKNRDEEEESEFDDDVMDDSTGDSIIDYVLTHLPNKIDFRGRVIFISNLLQDEWDTAILSRSFTANMEFQSAEMLDYIDKIKENIKTPGISDEQKQEVIDFIRDQWTLGRINQDINFRLVQQAFDLRLVDNWKRLIAML